MTSYELIQRLYKVYKIAIIVEETSSGCWRCTDRKPNEDGYTQIRKDGKLYRLHRLALNLTTIVLDGIDTFHALHSCDTRFCINPNHLRWGTNNDNIQDRMDRHRSQSSLSEKQVQEILSSNRTDMALARTFGVGKTTIRRVRLRETYTHVT